MRIKVDAENDDVEIQNACTFRDRWMDLDSAKFMCIEEKPTKKPYHGWKLLRIHTGQFSFDIYLQMHKLSSSSEEDKWHGAILWKCRFEENKWKFWNVIFQNRQFRRECLALCHKIWLKWIYIPRIRPERAEVKELEQFENWKEALWDLLYKNFIGNTRILLQLFTMR